jgi:hypothetical protein
MRFKIVLALLGVMAAIVICCKNETNIEKDTVVERVDTLVVLDTVETIEVTDTLKVIE